MPENTSRLSAALADRYRIDRRLGEGGMAAVYLAEDLKHDRRVALKVLKPELAAVLGAERFVQEIKTTASLQHPNILPLFDSGEAGGFLYYVMPYVDGETLRGKLDREKQLAVEEAVQITGDVADALESAHRQGVIHRDIKPENILLHNGRPLVADFGIALAVSAAAGGRMTETGLSLGTPHYMSPEQATAEKDLTGRSDVYSLGAVLYEMLTGDPPHTGSTAQQIIMKIVTDVPRPVTELRRSVPPNIAAAVAKALEKLPADRFDGAAGLKRALGDPAFTVGVAGAPLGPASAIRHSRFWMAATALSMLAAAVIATVRFGAAVPPPSRLRASIPLPKLGEDDGLFFNMDVSPDGEYVAATGVLGGEVGIWVRAIDSLAWRHLPGTNTGDIAWSPDGQSLAFFDGQQLKVASVGGGPVRVLADVSVGNQFYASVTWGRDGVIVFSPPALGPLFRVPATGGEPEVLTSVAPQANHRFPVFLPDGKHFLYTSEGGTDAGIYVASLDDPAGVLVLPDPSPIVFARSTRGSGGYVFFVRDGRVMVQSFDPGSLRLRGEPFAVVERVPWTDNGSVNVSVSDNGFLAYMGGRNRELDSRLVWTDRSGAVLGSIGTIGAPAPVSLSPDGRTAAVVRRPAASTRGDVWLWSLGRDVDTPFTFDSSLESRGNAAWSPESDRIAFVVSDSGSWKLVIGDVADKAQEELLRSETAIIVTDWSRSGDLIYTQLDPLTGSDIWYLHNPEEADRDSDPQVFLRDRFNTTFGQVSPDGRWIAYLSDETGGYEVWVASFPSGADRWLVSQGGGGVIGAQQPRWSHDGRELFYSMQGEGSRSFMAARVRAPREQGSSPLLPPQFLFKARANGYAPFQGTFFYDVSRDGERFLVNAIEEGGAGAEQIVHLVANWEAILLGGR